MTDLYLIAHKVRGQPAFDIAERCDDMDSEGDPGPWWIIPTSGHRAHPYWSQHLDQLGAVKDDVPDLPLDMVVPPMPSPWPDHYPTAAEPRNAPSAGHGLLARLGLLRKTTIKRRV